MPRRIPILLLTMLVVGVVGFSGCPNRPPQVPGAPVGQSSCYRDSSYLYLTASVDPDGDDVAFRFSWGDGETTFWTPHFPSGDTVGLPHTWDSVGSFPVTVIAEDLEGATSGWSDPLNVTVSVATQPPNRPTAPIGRSHGHVGINYVFESWAYDPDGDSVSIRFSWGDGDTSEWSAYNTSGGHVEFGHTWSAAGTTFVAAFAKDIHGALSWMSLASPFVCVEGNRPPETPEPPSGSTDCFEDSVSTFGAKTTDPDGDLVQFRFDWGDGDTSGWTNLVGSDVEAFSRHTWTEVDSFFVRVQARDELGSTSGWSGSVKVYADPGYPSIVVDSVAFGLHIGSPTVLPSGECIYIPIFDTGVAVVRTSSLTWESTIPLGNRPYKAAVLPSGGRVYVGGVEPEVSVINTSSKEVLKTFPVERNPGNLAATPDGGRVYVTNDMTAHLSVIETGIDTVAKVVDLGTSYADRVAASPCGEYVYVIAGSRVLKVRTPADTVVQRVKLSDPNEIAVSPDGSMLYLTEAWWPRDLITAVRAADLGVVVNIALEGNPNPQGIAVMPGGHYVYIANRQHDHIFVLRVRDNQLVRSIQMSNWSECVVFHPSGRAAYVTLRESLVALGY